MMVLMNQGADSRKPTRQDVGCGIMMARHLEQKNHLREGGFFVYNSVAVEGYSGAQYVHEQMLEM